MAEYNLSHKAVEDLAKILNYTYIVWSENQADKYYKLLIETCQEIAKQPNIGKNYKEISNEIFGFVVGKHIIFYRQLKRKEIEILRILHCRMDLKTRIYER